MVYMFIYQYIWLAINTYLLLQRNFLDNNNEEENGYTNKAYKPSLEEIDRKRRNKEEEKKGNLLKYVLYLDVCVLIHVYV